MKQPMLTKLDLALIAALLGVGILAIEADHRIELVPPAVAAAPDPCREADMRYGTNRLMFFDGGYVAGMRGRQAMIERFSVPPGCPR